MRPLSNDLREFIRLLAREGVEYLIVGAWSLAFHGRPRYTGDLDLFVRREGPNADRLMRALEAFGFGSAGLTRDDFLKEDFVIQLGVEPNRLDILTGISGVTFEEAWAARVAGTLEGLPVWFISRDLLIRNKKASGRDQDLADVHLLEAVCRSE
jgi:hypothetical protein